MADSKKLVERRRFLQKGALAGAALVSTPAVVAAQASQAAAAPAQAPPAPMTLAAETTPPGEVQVLGEDERCGSDYMVDVFKSLGFEYICANPGSSFRGLHESFINYGGNKGPELLTCCHEESSVAMAHAYYKAEGKPLAVMAHGTVGLQHASMAIYNAWCDRVPVYVILGNHADAAIRRGAEWYHGVQDAAAMVRDYTKWDDFPWSLTHFAESAVRAYQIALTPPMAPVVLVLDGGLQEHPVSRHEALTIPKLSMPVPPQGEQGAVEQTARMLVAAEYPVFVADRLARTPNGMKLLVELAETLQAGVIDQGSRMNFPSRHPLNQTQRARAAVVEADVIVGLELIDYWGTVNALRDQLHRSTRRVAKPTAKLVSISTGDLYIRANYQDFRRMQEVDLAIAADGEATLPALIDAVKRLTTADRRRVFEERGAKLAQASRAAAEASRVAASYAWEASPVSDGAAERRALGADQERRLVARLELLQQRPDELAAPPLELRQVVSVAGPRRRRRHRIRRAGVGRRRAGEPEARAALRRHPDRRRHDVRTGCALDRRAPQDSTAQRHEQQPRVPHGADARAEDVQRAEPWRRSRRHRQSADRSEHRLTRSWRSRWASMPKGRSRIPNDLGPALRRAIAVVKRGEPALVDVVTQVR